MCRQWVNISLSASCTSKVKSTNGSIRKGGRSWTTQNVPSPLISIIIPKSPDILMRGKRARCEYRRRLCHGFKGRLSWDHPLLSALLPQHMGVTPNSASMRYGDPEVSNKHPAYWPHDTWFSHSKNLFHGQSSTTCSMRTRILRFQKSRTYCFLCIISFWTCPYSGLLPTTTPGQFDLQSLFWSCNSS